MTKHFDPWLSNDKALNVLIHKIMNDETDVNMRMHPGDLLAILSLVWIALIKHTFDDEQLQKLVDFSVVLTGTLVKVFPDAQQYLTETMSGALAAQDYRRSKAGRAKRGL